MLVTRTKEWQGHWSLARRASLPHWGSNFGEFLRAFQSALGFSNVRFLHPAISYLMTF
jgi:hypothetical protein